MAEKATKRRITTPEDIEALVETDKAGIDIEQFDRGELKTILDRQLELVKRGVAPEAALRQAAGAVMKQNQTPKRRMTSLEQIELRTLNVTIYREGEDEAWEFELRELPRAKYFELARLIPDPTPPKKRDDPIDIMRVNGVIQRLYEIDELEYLQAQQRATNRRTMLRLLHCLVDFDVPGETENEKLDAMEAALPLDVVTGLIDAMNSFAEGSEARIEERAKSFRDGRDQPAVDAGSQGLVNRKMGQPKKR